MDYRSRIVAAWRRAWCPLMAGVLTVGVATVFLPGCRGLNPQAAAPSEFRVRSDQGPAKADLWDEAPLVVDTVLPEKEAGVESRATLPERAAVPQQASTPSTRRT